MYRVLLFLLSLSFYTRAEIIENIIKDEKKFSDWTIDCREDVMIGTKECKLFTKFYNNRSSIFIQPDNKIANQVVIMLPDALENSIIMVKVDKHPIINSDPFDKRNRYGVAPFSPKKQRALFSQMKNGFIMLIRFNIRDAESKGGVKEITEKISLNDFGKMLIYYDTKK